MQEHLQPMHLELFNLASKVYKHYGRRYAQKGVTALRFVCQAAKNISGDSMLVGCAHDLLKIGRSLPQIMVKGGWAKSDTLMRFIQGPSQWHSNY